MSGSLAFVTGFLFSLSLCFDLGMVNINMIKTAIERGLRPAFLFGFGSAIGDLIYLSLALLGFSAILQLDFVRWAVWIGGTAVLLYFTYSMLRDTFRARSFVLDGVSVTDRTPLSDVLWGIGIALSSPTAILWFAAAAGPIAASDPAESLSGLMLFMSGFFIAGLLWSFGISLVGTRSGQALGERFVRTLSFISALMFLYFAAHVFWDGWKQLM
ncbi:LysE family transporter [Paenibacillus sp. GD4]|uniref:LysE family translocator n=1 Tax=Paenibacillus sp. GD4 TaxID=3068890 RepID=UPI0027966959|nr:LysE family transporter [Paenibacillus sp. GD4]MDQ1911034.1 LysE family transporter [Paenibacillus sp. GD4]